MRRLVRTVRRLLLTIVVGAVPGIAFAQQITPEQLQQLLGQQGIPSSASQGAGSSQLSPPVIVSPTSSNLRPLPTTQLEAAISQRAGQKLELFGYADVGVGRAVLLPQAGGVQDNYILGPGDEIVVSLRGQESNEYRVQVDRNGRVILPRLNPIGAAGRTFGEFRTDLENAIARSYVATQVFASIGTVRQIRVTIGGEINSPGVRILTGLSSPLDAIFASNGIKKSGSLRNIQIVRNGQRIRLDLYGVLRNVGSVDLPLLTDGDQIVVPPLGPVVAVAGPVSMPGIFELAPGQSSISARNLIALAGGFSLRGRYDLSVVQLQDDGRTELVSLPDDGGLLRDSDILVAHPTAEQTGSRITLSGAGTFDGSYAAQATRLSDVLKRPGVLGPDAYPLLAVVSRRDPITLVRTLVGVTPASVLAGKQDMQLQSDDIVQLLNRDDISLLLFTVSQFEEQKQRDAENLRSPQSAQSAQPNLATAVGEASRQVNANRTPGAFESGNLGALGVGGIAPTQGNGGGPNAAIGAGNISNYPGANAAPPNYGPYAPGAMIDANNNQSMYGEPSAQTYGGSPSALNMPGSMQPFQRDQLQSAAQYDSNGRLLYERPHNVLTLAQALKVDQNVLLAFLSDRSVTVTGAIRGPGTYMVGPDLDLNTLIQAAGGTQDWFNATNVERVSTFVDASTGQATATVDTLNLAQNSAASIIVRSHDQFRFSEVQTGLQTGSVTLQGEVRNPGVYQILKGEHLSEMLARAGGLTTQAYPYGAVFLRKAVAAREQEAIDRTTKDINNQLILSISNRNAENQAPITGDTINAVRALLEDLRSQKALGRVSITADPAVLATRPEIDPLLEPGDVLYIPQRPTTVTVLGEVLHAASFPSEAGLTAKDYIEHSGGYTRFADESSVFIVLPDGTARQAEMSWLSIGSDSIPPGSTIVVPRDLEPLSFGLLIRQTTQVLSQMAVTAASLAVISKQ